MSADELPPAAAVAALLAEEAAAAGPVTSRRAQPRGRARNDGGAQIAAQTPTATGAALYRGGHADARLRRALARLRRRPDPEVQALAEQLAAEAAAALVALADRADAGDPVLQRRKASLGRRQAALEDQLATLTASRARRATPTTTEETR